MSRKLPLLKDPRGGHTRLYWAIQDSPAWRGLTHTERSLWFSMRRQLNSHNNGDIQATLTKLAPDGFTAQATLTKSLRALVTLGLIAKTRQGAIAHGGKTCSLFRFTDEACYDIPKLGIKQMPASNEWRSWACSTAATAAVDAAHEAAKNPLHRNSAKAKAAAKAGTTKIQKPNRSSSKAESEVVISDSAFEHSSKPPIQALKNVVSVNFEPKCLSLLDIALARRAALTVK